MADSESESILTIPISTIYRPTYAHAFYKLPDQTIKYWDNLGIRIGRCLGEGAFATAYEGKYGDKAKLPEGKDQYLGKDFAVKVIHVGYHPFVPGSPYMDKVDDETKNELNIANRKDLIFENIIQFHFTAEYPPNENPPLHVFIFMEKAMFPLQDLFNCLIKMRTQVPSSRGLKWMVGIINAVIHLHSLQIIHSDLHSFNIFVTGDSQNQIGNSFRFQNIDVKIADFGKAIDVSKDKDSQKSHKKSQEMERLCLTLITICNLIEFSEDIKKKVVNSLNEVYQKKISVDRLLKSPEFECPKKIDEWTIFITQ
jgi:serine/threonine protein kinase